MRPAVLWVSALGDLPKVVALHPTADKTYLAAIDQLEATLAEPSEDREHPAVGRIRQLIIAWW